LRPAAAVGRLYLSGDPRDACPQAVARPSEVDDWRQTTAKAESSTCRSETFVTGGEQVAIAEHHIYDF
jgi:hypothetical protein